MKSKYISHLSALLVLGMLAGVLGCQATVSAPTPTSKSVGTSTPTATPASRPRVNVEMRAGEFGTTGYVVFTGFEELFRKHPWINAINAAAPGALWTRKYVIEQKSDTLIGALMASEWQSEGQRSSTVGTYQSLPGYKDTRTLGRYNNLGQFFVTFDPKIKTVYDLEGKRVALGAKSQGAHAVNPMWALERDLGIKANYVFTGGAEGAVQALIDGKADASTMTLYFSYPPNKTVRTPQYLQMEGSGKKFYAVGYPTDPATIAKIKEGSPEMKSGSENILTVPPGHLTGQTEPFGAYPYENFIGVYKDFREDIAYEFVHYLLGHVKELYPRDPLFELITPDFLSAQIPRDFLHPGAIKAYVEAGILKP